MGRFDRGERRPSDHAPDIEFLAPRSDLFDSGATTDRRPPRSARGAGAAQGDGDGRDARDEGGDGDDDGDDRPARWRTAIAVVSLASLVAVGVAVAAPWDTGPAAERSSSSTTAAAPPVASAPRPFPDRDVPPVPGGFEPAERVADGPVPVHDPAAPDAAAADAAPAEAIAATGYLVDPVLLPDRWHVAGGLTPTGAPAGADASAGWLELWATPGATRTTGAWFAVQTRRSEDEPLVRQDAARLALADDRTALLSTAVDGVSELVFRSGDLTVTITYAGWSDEGLAEVAGAIRFVDGGRPRFADDRFRSDHQLVLARPSTGIDLASDVFETGVLSAAHYRGIDADGRPATIEITTRVADPDVDGTLAQFVLTDPIVLADSGTLFTPPGSDAVLSADLSFPQAYAPRGKHLLQWTIGSRTVQLTTTLTLYDLNRILPLSLVRAGSVDAWARVQRGSIASSGQADAPFVELGSGRLDDGSVWTIDLQRERGWVDAMITGQGGDAHLIQLDLSFRACGTSATVATVVLVCVAPAGAATVLRVDGADDAELDLTPMRGDPGWSGAVVRIDGLGPFRVGLVAPDGSIETALAVGTSPA